MSAALLASFLGWSACAVSGGSSAVAQGSLAPTERQDPSGASASLRVRAPDLHRPLTETLLPPARPDEPVRAAVFDRINADRTGEKLPPVAWDEAAARVADAFCRAQIEERSNGHFLEDGIPPYARTAFAGVFGLQAENSVSWITTDRKFSDPPLLLALAGEEQMISERPPNDGHRQTILDPEATHVGVGWALWDGRFQMAQEFLVRHLERLTLSLPDPRSAAVRIEGEPVAGERLRFVVVGRDPEPTPLTREQASARTSYSYPRSYVAYLPEGTTLLRVAGVRNDDRIRLRDGGEFSFFFVPEGPGLFTLTFYFSRSTGTPRPGASATIWVERRP